MPFVGSWRLSKENIFKLQAQLVEAQHTSKEEERGREEEAGAREQMQRALDEAQRARDEAATERDALKMAAEAAMPPTCELDDSIGKRLCCSICCEVLTDPVSLPCGHTFDKQCLRTCVIMNGTARLRWSSCPTCRQSLPQPLPPINLLMRDWVRSKYPKQAVARRAAMENAAAASDSFKTLGYDLDALDWNVMKKVDEVIEQETDVESLRALAIPAWEERVWSTQRKIDAVMAEVDISKLREHALALTQAGSASKRHAAVRWFLLFGADAQVFDDCGISALLHAVLGGDVSLVRLLVEAGADVNEVLDVGQDCWAELRSEHGVTPLYWAARLAHVEVVRYLIEAGADVNMGAKSPLRGAILIQSDLVDHRKEVMRILIEAGSRVNHCSSDCVTPLGEAAWRRDAAAIRTLIKAGADVNQQSRIELYGDGRLCAGLREMCTPLDIARKFNGGEESEVAELLEASGAVSSTILNTHMDDWQFMRAMAV